jgi:hypothetical protein
VIADSQNKRSVAAGQAAAVSRNGGCGNPGGPRDGWLAAFVLMAHVSRLFVEVKSGTIQGAPRVRNFNFLAGLCGILCTVIC